MSCDLQINILFCNPERPEKRLRLTRKTVPKVKSLRPFTQLSFFVNRRRFPGLFLVFRKIFPGIYSD